MISDISINHRCKIGTFNEEYQYFLSYHQLLFPIILTEFLRRASLLPLEHTIEIGQIVEAAVIAHLCNSTRGIYQHTRGKAQTDINNVVGKRLAGAQAKETAERDRGHAHHIGQ